MSSLSCSAGALIAWGHSTLKATQVNSNQINQMLVFVHKGKPEYPEKNLSAEQTRTQPTSIKARLGIEPRPSHWEAGHYSFTHHDNFSLKEKYARTDVPIIIFHIIIDIWN